MPAAPQYRKRPQQAAPTRQPERRLSSSERGYGTAWAKYSLRLRQERVLCELCMAAWGIETPCAGQTTTESGRKRSQGVVDHILPIFGPDDPIFWMVENHEVICNSCNAKKSMAFDGTYAKAKRHAHDRTLVGISQRRREIVDYLKADAKKGDAHEDYSKSGRPDAVSHDGLLHEAYCNHQSRDQAIQPPP